jgi:hypothetical protein
MLPSCSNCAITSIPPLKQSIAQAETMLVCHHLHGGWR